MLGLFPQATSKANILIFPKNNSERTDGFCFLQLFWTSCTLWGQIKGNRMRILAAAIFCLQGYTQTSIPGALPGASGKSQESSCSVTFPDPGSHRFCFLWWCCHYLGLLYLWGSPDGEGMMNLTLCYHKANLLFYNIMLYKIILY